MARVYLSFLGTNDYVECFYFRDGFEMDRAVRFVQEATVEDNCKKWGPEDRIIIFTTRDAAEKNWEDDGHRDHQANKRLKRKGLESCLTGLSLAVPVTREVIPDGHTEDEIWEIFEKVSQCLNQGDEVVFDITHAFRSIPLVALVVLNYVKVLRDVKLNGIYYGAFEALGSIQKVKAMPVKDRRVRILNLTPLAELMDWTIATDRFLAAGDASMAGALAREGATNVLRASGGTNEAARAIKQLGSAMEKFTTMILTCRGPDISALSCILSSHVRRAKELDLPRPFRPLFQKLEQRLGPFNGEALQDGLAAVRWCVDHNLIQQGYTLLEEVLFSYVVDGVGGDHQNVTQREIASDAFTVLAMKWMDDRSRWGKEGGKNHELMQRMVDFILKHGDLYKIVQRVRKRRNDLNHAGFNEGRLTIDRAFKFAEELHEYIIGLENTLILERH